MATSRDILLHLAYKYKNDWISIWTAVKSRENLDLNKTPTNYLFGDKAVTFLDSEYPVVFRNFLRQPPFVIYYKGDIRLLEHKNYTLLIGDNIFDINTKDIIKYDKDTNTLLIGDNLQIYVSKDSKDVLNVGAFLCDKVVITKELKGVPISTTFALEYGKDIYAVPTTTPSSNNNLIKCGAFLLDSKGDIL